MRFILIHSLLTLLFGSITLTQAQVGIGTANPSTSAQLEVSSTTKGFLPPRMTNAQRTAISSPESGLMVYQTDGTAGLYYYEGSNWIFIINSASSTLPVANGGTGASTAAGAIASLGVVASSEKGATNGVATLGSDGKIPSVQIPAVSFQSANVVANEAAMLGLTNAVVGSIAIRADLNKNFVLSANPYSITSNWIELATPTSVTSVNGSSGPNVTLTAASLSATTIGNNLFTLANPGAISFPRFNANNTVSALSAADFRLAIGAGTSSTAGTVTSVGLTLPTILSVSGSPVTSSGTISATLANQNANTIFAGPSSGSTAAPTFRALVAADIPTLNQNTTGTASNVTGIVLPANGGTGLSSLGAGVATFLGTPSSANLATAVTNETGSGSLVFGTSPTLTTPTISSGSDQFPNSLQINPSTHATSRRAAIWIDGWSLLQDVNGNGTKNFSIGQTVIGTPTTYPSRLFISTSGDIGIGNIQPIARLDARTNPGNANPGEGYLGIGTTSTAANTAGAGALRYDNTGGELEYSNGTAWKPLAVTDAAQTFSGTQTFSNSVVINGASGTGTGLRLTTGASSGKVLTSDVNGNASWETGAVVIYTEVHAFAGNGADYANGADFNDFGTVKADNVVQLYGNTFGFFNGSGTGSLGDRWVAPRNGKYRITTNAYFNASAYTNPRLYAYKNNTEVCNITSAQSSTTSQDIATSTSAIISMNQGDYINWKVQGGGARIYRGEYHTFFRIESVE